MGPTAGSLGGDGVWHPAGVSPKSRGRKKRPSARKSGQPRHDDWMGPELDDIFAEILNTAGAELAGLRDPLQAEMLVSELLGIWSGQLLVDADPDVVFGEGLIEHAQRRGTPAAQAVLRGIAAVGTDRQRTKAATAAAALAAQGIIEPTWVDELAHTEVTGCWAYGDVYGDQTSVLLGFERSGEQHGLVVLIDHTLGGIAKDAFIAEDPAAALAAIRAEADGLLISLREITPAEAREIVEPAIATTDMAFDPPLGDTYRATRALALARLRTLPAPAEAPADALGRPHARGGKRKGRPALQPLFDIPAAETPRPEPPPGSGDPAASCYQVKITLRHVKPPVWRRLQLPGSITLGELHDVIQTAMGWEGYHLHVFTAGQHRYGQRTGDWSDWDPELRDEGSARLADIAPTVGDKLRYEYDFGDGWEHDIAVEEISPVTGPIGVTCAAGRRACPPEDCGGPWGYAELCDAVADPGHERHDELLGWLGGHFNPAAFDRDAVNARLVAIRSGKIRG